MHKQNDKTVVLGRILDLAALQLSSVLAQINSYKKFPTGLDASFINRYMSKISSNFTFSGDKKMTMEQNIFICLTDKFTFTLDSIKQNY